MDAQPTFDLETNEPTLVPIDQDAGPAWQEVAQGRFRPRRIKGSCVGRELG